jgi:hypothetical protein
MVNLRSGSKVDLTVASNEEDDEYEEQPKRKPNRKRIKKNERSRSAEDAAKTEDTIRPLKRQRIVIHYSYMLGVQKAEERVQFGDEEEEDVIYADQCMLQTYVNILDAKEERIIDKSQPAWCEKLFHPSKEYPKILNDW